jgi:glycosyltransferase involved in cell wall biosynthesis
MHVMRPGRDHIAPNITTEEIRMKASQSNTLRLLFIGNLIRRKGLHSLLTALAHQPLEHWQLTVVGDARIDKTYTRELIRQTRRLGLENRVHFKGFLTSDALADELRSAHLLVIPSEYEGYGIAYLEAMGYGVVPIASTAGGAGEMIKHGENGYLVDPGDSESLAALLHTLSINRVKLQQLATAARGTYEGHKTWAEGAEGVRQFLKNILSSNF